MENGTEEEGPNPIVFRLVWGLVAVVAVGSVWVVWDAYQKQVERNQAGIFEAGAPEVGFRPAEEHPDHALDAPIGEISLGLKANLSAAETTVPDRPHNPDEVRSRTVGDGFTRRRTFTISTNTNGIRIADNMAGQGHTYVGRKKGFRIVAMGASESFGWGVPYEESYPAHLAKMLNVEVVNASAPAGITEQMVRWATKHLASLEPDLVIYALRPPYPEKNPAEAFAKTLKALGAVSGDAPLVVVLPALSTFDLQMPELIEAYAGAADPVKADVDAVSAALGTIPVIGLTQAFRDGQKTYAGGAPGEVLVTMQTVDGKQILTTPNGDQILSATAPEIPKRSPFFGLPPSVIAKEVLAAFEAQPNMREPLFFDGGHPDAEGYRLMAETVANTLKERGLVP